jgi:hypothetical protein
MDTAIFETLVQQAAQAEARLAQIESKLSGDLPVCKSGHRYSGSPLLCGYA